MNILLNQKPQTTPSIDDFLEAEYEKKQQEIAESRKQEKLEIIKSYLGKSEEEIKTRPTSDDIDPKIFENI